MKLNELKQSGNPLLEHIQQLLNEMSDVEDKSVQQLTKMLDAAKKGMSIAHGLKPSKDKAKHMKQLMVNLNKIKGALARAKKSEQNKK